jgi:hypothetical protein
MAAISTHKGPPPAGVAGIFTLLFLSSIILSRILTHNAPLPMPYGNPWLSQQYFLTFPYVVRLSGFLQLGSAIALAILTASLTIRLRFLGITATGPQIALAGGIAASTFLAFSGLVSWVLAQPGTANTFDTMRSLQLLGFVSGGVAHTATLGLLVAGIAVPCLLLKLLPKGWAIAGIVIAAFAELSTLSMILPQLSFLLPLARFPAMVWLIVAGACLPRSKPQ